MTRLHVQCRWTAALENGSEQQPEQGEDVFWHPSSSTFFLEEHDRKVSIGDWNITNMRFADDIDA